MLPEPLLRLQIFEKVRPSGGDKMGYFLNDIFTAMKDKINLKGP
jgi:hypothetical protein